MTNFPIALRLKLQPINRVYRIMLAALIIPHANIVLSDELELAKQIARQSERAQVEPTQTDLPQTLQPSTTKQKNLESQETAFSASIFEACYLDAFKQSDGSEKTVAQIKQECDALAEQPIVDNSTPLTPLEKRLEVERLVNDNPNVITPHKQNYLLPITYMGEPNEAPYENTRYAGNLSHWESKFQLSFKAPLASKLLSKKDNLYFGFTVQSYWQAYNSDISSPFRESNYTPEIFYRVENSLKVGSWTNRFNDIGIEHQSNGQSQPQSRSWNRIYARIIWEKDEWVLGLKPWYRIPEDDKSDLNDPKGDDNPDIDKYMGYFEFSSVYKWDQQTFGVMLRNNLRKDNKGAVQLDWTFPMGSRFKGYLQVFNGYGESLIDYNHSVTRIGLGVLLTDYY